MARLLLAVASAATAGGATLHDNYVYWDTSGSVSVVSYTLTEYAVTSGQPWGGIGWAGNMIDVKAGRSGSDNVARVFVNGLNPSCVLATISGPDQLPETLNFATFGNITFNLNGASTSCGDFRLAQGHVVGINNWWMGGPGCYGGTSNTLVCRCDNGRMLQFKTEGQSDRMIVAEAHKAI
ncbi:hypothetical protein DIPPA_05572 [Diplonema papillatum]|nr:hypothetical protein DIPPA_05543 [Diplonema papillatum]KAJ9462180.1 hypothetical protein DIPPA_05572 [Diplonema papillatum]